MAGSLRLAKILLVAMVAFFTSLVVFNNLTDYYSNFYFVQHVLMMDTTFPDNAGMWRSINSPFLHHAFYAFLIASEVAVALLAIWGVVKLWGSRNDGSVFNRAKAPAVWALVSGIALWFGGFIAVGGEWFLMWQSGVWNGQEAAFRIVTVFGLILLFLVQDDQS